MAADDFDLLIEAAVLRVTGGDLTLEQVRLAGLRDDEVRVRLAATGVCHTDLTMMQRLNRPFVLGHEGAGVIEAVGAAVMHLAVGDHVVMSYSACRSCNACNEGAPFFCEHFAPMNFGGTRLDGSSPLRDSAGEVLGACFFGQSSFATHAVARACDVVKVRKDAPLKLLGPLGCGFLTGAGTVMTLMRPGPRSSLAVFGTGAVGCAAIMAARSLGCGRIIAVDRVGARLDLARSLGATETINPSEADLAAELAGLGGIDFAVETTGVAAVIEAAIGAVRPRGLVALHAVAGEGVAAFDVRKLLSGQTIKGVCEGCADPQVMIPHLIDMYLAGTFPIDRLVSFYPFAEVGAAIADARSGRVVKPVLVFDGEA